jgi:hypothetical protein
MPPAYNKPTPTPKPKPKVTPGPHTPAPKKPKLYTGGGTLEFKPFGSGNSAMTGGFLGGGGGPMGLL